MAKYFHKLNAQKTIGLIRSIIPLLISLALFLLVAVQPDLGTALIILILGLVAIFYAGIKLIYPIISLMLIALVSPFLWTLLKPYQQNRIMIFLNPDLDPLGKGYHIIQSKIIFVQNKFETLLIERCFFLKKKIKHHADSSQELLRRIQRGGSTLDPA